MQGFFGTWNTSHKLSCMKYRFLFYLFFIFFIIACSSDDDIEKEEINPQGEIPEVISNESFLLNPSGYAPLSATISLETREAVNVRLHINGQNGFDSDIVKDFGLMGDSFTIPVHGLSPDASNEVSLILSSTSGGDLGTRTYLMQTGRLLADLPDITIQKAEREQMAPGLTLVSYFGHNGATLPQRPFMFDAFGTIRWYLDFRTHPDLNQLFYDDGIERLANGNLYFGSGGGSFGGAADNLIYEVDLFGNVLNTWPMDGYSFHHEVHEKPNGNFLVTVNKIGAPTIEDYIIEIDRDTKQIVNEWNLNLSLDNTRKTLTSDEVDWIHVNAVTYDASDDTIIISGRTQGVIKLNANNEVVWIMSPHKGWGISGNGVDLNSFLLQPLDRNGMPINSQVLLDGDENHPEFEWNWYQHAPLIMPNGNIMLFDNGDNRNYTGASKYSRAVEYKIDKAARTIQQIWQYGKQRGEETYSRIVSDVDFMEEEGHVLFSPGAISYNNEILGKSIEIDYESGAIIFEANIIPPTAFFGIITLHRTERLPLYPD